MDTNRIAAEINTNILSGMADRRKYVMAILSSDDAKEFIARNLPAVKKLIQNSNGGLISQSERYVRVDFDFQLDTIKSGWINLLLGIYADIYGIENDVYFDYNYSGITEDELNTKSYSLKSAIETIFSGKDVEVAAFGKEVNLMN